MFLYLYLCLGKKASGSLKRIYMQPTIIIIITLGLFDCYDSWFINMQSEWPKLVLFGSLQFLSLIIAELDGSA